MRVQCDAGGSAMGAKAHSDTLDGAAGQSRARYNHTMFSNNSVSLMSSVSKQHWTVFLLIWGQKGPGRYGLGGKKDLDNDDYIIWRGHYPPSTSECCSKAMPCWFGGDVENPDLSEPINRLVP